MPSRWGVALAGVLALALGLRLWGIKHGLPYVYNIDENSNFVPKAVAFFSGDYNPHYFVNPPAFSYLLHGVLAVWFGGGWPFGSRWAVSDAYATDPTAVFVVARATAALLGTAAVVFVYATGTRLFDRRVGLIAAALIATAFLPVFYSHMALNDVPALLALTVSVYGSAGVLTRGRMADYVIAGAGLGLAVATKYTAAIVLLPLLAAAGSRLARSREERDTALRGVALALVVAAAAFVIVNPYALLSFSESWADVKRQGSAAAGVGKLGLGDTPGILYYLWVLTWGMGWVPAVAAAVGSGLMVRSHPKRALLLIPWPVALILFMGLQDRYFGRWLLPALPAVALLAAFAAVRLSELWASAPRVRNALVAGAGAALVAQSLVHDVHVDRVLSRDDTRALARRWMVENVPPGSKVVIEPMIPVVWTTDPGRTRPVTPTGRRWNKFLTGRTTVDERGRRRRGGVGRTVTVENYERTTRPELIGAYARGGFCWVVIGSTQYGRAFADPAAVPRAIRYYRSLGRRGDLVYKVDPYRPGRGPVRFSFDWSFNYYPAAYRRPGPTVVIYRLTEASCAAG